MVERLRRPRLEEPSQDNMITSFAPYLDTLKRYFYTINFPPFTRWAVCPPRAPPECFYGIILGLRHVMRLYFMLNYLKGNLPKSPKIGNLVFNISVLSHVKIDPNFLTLRPYFTSKPPCLRGNSDIPPTFCFSDIYFYLCGR